MDVEAAEQPLRWRASGYVARVDVLVLSIVIVMAVALVWMVTANPWLPVSQTVVIPGMSASKLEQPMLLLLSNVSGAEVSQTAVRTFTLQLRRSPAWIWPPLVLTFPLGLLFLLVKQTGSLQVTLAANASGTEVRMVGRTKKSVVKTLAKALGSLAGVVSDR